MDRSPMSFSAHDRHERSLKLASSSAKTLHDGKNDHLKMDMASV